MDGANRVCYTVGMEKKKNPNETWLPVAVAAVALALMLLAYLAAPHVAVVFIVLIAVAAVIVNKAIQRRYAA